jgi:lipid II:glycine glycyltransferase (peptidoglycan interpeptide bridge formation enzyme)
MELKTNQEIDVHEWKYLVASSSNSSIFQTQEFYEFFKGLKGFDADVFAIKEDESYTSLIVVTIQKEQGVKSFFSRRGIIYGGPIISNSESCRFLIQEVELYYKNKLIYLETRNFNNYQSYKDIFLSFGWSYTPWLNYQLLLNNEDQLKKGISASRWRQINKAIKSGAIWCEARSLADVMEFYLILKDLYTNKIRKPLFNWEFFKNFYESELGKYLLVYYKDKVIGGIMCPVLLGKTIYEFYVCGLDKEYKEQSPSVMATWAAIEYGLQNNIALFDFMGAGHPDEDYGVREFKARFGGTELEHGRFIKIFNPFMYSLGKFGLKMLSKIKS